jgi:glycosyltransferase involved in cell wall biosynthesis
MKFSVFTPTHRPDYIGEAFDSLVAQSHTDWEWVLVPNGPRAELPDRIRSDPRVRIIPAPDGIAAHGVGALKRFACEQCRGDYLVELDHDDVLTADALAEIAKAAAETNAGFLYSDFTNFRADGTCEVYDKGYGWESYPFEYGGRAYTAMRAFEADASALHLIFFAPNHVRVWSRETYAKAGGHDAALGVVDDHDLLCRTYITGTPFHHIAKCLYLYRLLPDGQNTYVQRNAEIQQRQQEISNRYVYGLIAEWCRRRGLPMYDLGGATGCPPGYKSVDLRNADLVCDIRQGLPLPDSSVGCIRAYDFLEHIPLCRDSTCDHGGDGVRAKCVVGLMNELYRVLAPGGWLVTRTPSTDGRGAFQDPTHVSFWNPNSFWYYTRTQQAQYVPGIRCRFQGTRIWQTFPTEWHKTHDIMYVYADLVALKGQRQPGVCEI